MHFCHLRKAHDDPVLTLDGTPIPVVEETNFLGVIFDKKLTFITHIKKLKAKCQKALNLLRVVAHTDWGADRKVQLHLYRTVVRSKLDYGSIVYGSARESYLKTLDTIYHQGIRLALGAFRTSPVDSLLVEANEPSLNDRQEELSLQFALKLKSNRSNPLSRRLLGIRKTDDKNVNGNMVGIREDTNENEEKAKVIQRASRDKAD